MQTKQLCTEEEFYVNWYDWELIHENYNQDIKPEEIIAVNRGFGTSKGLTAIAGKIEWVDEKKQYQFSSIRISKSRRISFYNNGFGLYEIVDLFKSPNKSQLVVMRELNNFYQNSDLYVLDNSNIPIYLVNEKASLSLDNEQNIRNYIHFFFINVAGRHGRFYPCEDINQINNLICYGSKKTEYIDYYAGNRNKIEEKFGKFPDMSIKDEQIDFTKDPIQIKGVYLIFKDSLFSANVSIGKNDGIITLSDEELIIEFALYG